MDRAACIVDTFGTDLAISTERTAVSDTAAIAEANSLFILCSSSCSPKLRTAASRHERPFHNGSLRESDLPVVLCPTVLDGSSETQPSYRLGDLDRIFLVSVSFSFRGSLTDKNDQLVILGGGTEIKLRWEGGDECATFHFDVHKKQDGHPMLHMQFASAVTEVPRLLSFYAHPLDVLEFTLMELFQADWQRSRIGTRCLADLQKYPEFQRNRIVAVMRQYTDWLHADERTTPLLSLQSHFALPFDLYPNP
jgi:hypothetical protein